MRTDFRTAGPDEENRNIVILIKRLAIQFDRQTNPEFERYGLTGAQYKVLRFLFSSPGGRTRIVDIRKKFSMAHPTVIGLVDQLCRKGYAQREDNPEDARGRLVALTDRARALEEELNSLSARLGAELTSSLSGEECETLRELLFKLIDDDPDTGEMVDNFI